MLFTQGTFWLLFAAVFVLLRINAWAFRSVPVQNLIIFVASYVFYGAWDWRYLSLVTISTLVDFTVALKLETLENPRARRALLLVSVAVSLTILGVFKYYNFFSAELAHLLQALGFQVHWTTLNILLPVGISFYTLQTMSYAIDVYYRRYTAERSLLRYATWVAFFPQLVAGPIERAMQLLPQFGRVARFDWRWAYQGIALIVFGMFLKVVIADNLAPEVDRIFANYRTLGGGELLLGGIYFSVQIYTDFCGYSTIAIGLAAILGFQLITNFETPYFATSISGFWKSWNMSLTAWFRDYVYALIRKGRRSEARINLAMIGTFMVSGLWHGANWTFITWGLMHGLALVAERRIRAAKIARGSDQFRTFAGWAITMSVVLPSMIVFRSPTLEIAGVYLSRMLTDFAIPMASRSALLYVGLMVLVDWLWHRDVRLTDGPDVRVEGALREPLKALLLAVMLLAVLINNAMTTDLNAFIYFQF